MEGFIKFKNDALTFEIVWWILDNIIDHVNVSFTDTLTGLIQNKTYCVRAFVKYNPGSYSCPGPVFSDIKSFRDRSFLPVDSTILSGNNPI